MGAIDFNNSTGEVTGFDHWGEADGYRNSYDGSTYEPLDGRRFKNDQETLNIQKQHKKEHREKCQKEYDEYMKGVK